jgi:hypothetical protein
VTAAGDEGRGNIIRCDRELIFNTDGKGRKYKALNKVFVMDTEYEGERGHGLLYRPGSSVNGISLPEVLYIEGGGEGWGARFRAA